MKKVVINRCNVKLFIIRSTDTRVAIHSLYDNNKNQTGSLMYLINAASDNYSSNYSILQFYELPENKKGIFSAYRQQ